MIRLSYKKTIGYLVFDIKINFTRKVQWILNRFENSVLEGSTYAEVVSIESVWIAFTYVALNNINIWVYNI